MFVNICVCLLEGCCVTPGLFSLSCTLLNRINNKTRGYVVALTGPSTGKSKPVAVGDRAVDDQAYVSALHEFSHCGTDKRFTSCVPSGNVDPCLLIAHHGPRYQLHKKM